jgi:C1A family cysteine protease
VASLESVNAIHGNHHLYNLSEQELVDCSTSYGNFGCGGGLMDNAFKFMMKSGVALYTEYPYNASDGSCNKSECKSMVNVTGYSDVPQNNETQLMMAVSKNPVSVAIDASDPTFQFYKSGVYNVSDCYNQLDHGVTAVGYGRDEVYNVDYWIVKNSWNVSWGNDGYIYMLRNYEQPEGMCGIAMDASYPLV